MSIKLSLVLIAVSLLAPLTHAQEVGNRMKVTGEFRVDLTPMDFSVEGSDGIKFGRMSINKVFSGALDANSKGEMLSAMTSTQGSAGYVAIEQVSGSLEGRKGSFVLQHFGTMGGGNSNLLLEVVPDSGTGELAGLSGQMKIIIDNGSHSYEFEYKIND